MTLSRQEEAGERMAVDPSRQNEKPPPLAEPSAAPRTGRRKNRAASGKNAGPVYTLHPPARVHPPKPTGGNAARRPEAAGFGADRFALQWREKLGMRRIADRGQHAGTANWLEKASQTPMWAPAAPLRKNTYIGSPGPWNETPRVDGNTYRGKPMPPELAPGLDLYGTNEGLTELFDEGGNGEEDGGRAEREERGESEQSVDDNDVHADAPLELQDGGGIRETLSPTPASVQSMLHRMRARIREQEAYIQDLEDQILKLNDN